MTKYVAVTFKPEDKRTYTYTWDGPDLFPGDRVKVPDNRSDGWKAVTVDSISDQAPPFPCKAIIGRVEDGPIVGEANIQEEPDTLLATGTVRDPGDDPVVQF